MNLKGGLQPTSALHGQQADGNCAAISDVSFLKSHRLPASFPEKDNGVSEDAATVHGL
jgi:hypothetical protein